MNGIKKKQKRFIVFVENSGDLTDPRAEEIQRKEGPAQRATTQAAAKSHLLPTRLSEKSDQVNSTQLTSNLSQVAAAAPP